VFVDLLNRKPSRVRSLLRHDPDLFKRFSWGTNGAEGNVVDVSLGPVGHHSHKVGSGP
jgi:hypothetical protein